MAARRVTNNSVASLDEQSDLLQSIMSKEAAVKPTDKKDKKARKTKTSATGKREKVKPAAAATLASQLDEYVDMPDPSDQSEQGEPLTWQQAEQGVQMGMYANAVPGEEYESDSQADLVSESEERPVHDISLDTVSQPDMEEEQVLLPKEKIIPEIKKKGVCANILKENIAHVKEADKVSPKLPTELAFGVDKYLKDCVFTSDMEKLSKQYPRVENLEFLKVPRLDVEVYQVIEQKVRNNDQSLQTVQKSIVAAVSALSPLLELAFERADSDQELDESSRGLWDSIQLMAHALNGISARRRELIKPCLAPIYARVLTKGHETTPDWLYGGNLLETTKKCEAAKKLSEKLLKPKPQQQQQQQQKSAHFRGGKQVSRGRGQMRAFNPYQSYRVPQNQQQQVPQPVVYYPPNTGFQDGQRAQKFHFQYPQQNQNQQGFPKNKLNNFQK